MKKLGLSVCLTGMLLSSAAMAGEPIRLADEQLDRATAGNFVLSAYFANIVFGTSRASLDSEATSSISETTDNSGSTVEADASVSGQAVGFGTGVGSSAVVLTSSFLVLCLTGPACGEP